MRAASRNIAQLRFQHMILECVSLFFFGFHTDVCLFFPNDSNFRMLAVTRIPRGQSAPRGLRDFRMHFKIFPEIFEKRRYLRLEVE